MNDSVMIRAPRFKCAHNKFVLDPTLAHVECGICGEKLNPMWVIEQYANREHRAWMRIFELDKIAEKAVKKDRCKCEKCGEMTRIVKV